MAGVAPAGSDDTGGDAMLGWIRVSITLGQRRAGADPPLKTGEFVKWRTREFTDSPIHDSPIHRFTDSPIPMIVLSLDTTTRTGSAAVVRDGDVLHEAAGDPARSQGERLPGDLMRVLNGAGVPIGDVDLFAVAAGPGSFTGLRVGIATMQALAMSAGRTIVPVSVLDALAASCEWSGPVAAWMDAQRGQVFGALYAAGTRALLAKPTAQPPAATLESWRTLVDLAAVTYIGDGAVRYGDVLREVAGNSVRVIEPPLLAGVIGRMAAADPSRAVLPHAVEPVYVRAPDAELARARQQSAPKA
jgi:tRNA threonylcarbamoyladenosine biosynthesis protein TsaB